MFRVVLCCIKGLFFCSHYNFTFSLKKERKKQYFILETVLLGIPGWLGIRDLLISPSGKAGNIDLVSLPSVINFPHVSRH